MVRPVLVKVNPNILTWARNSSGYTLREVAKKLNISYNTLRVTENGVMRLTVKQLRKLAKFYKRPLPIFYLKNTPKDIELPDFRSRSIDEEIGIVSGKIRLIIREILEKKKIAEDLYEKLNISYPYDFIGLFSESDSIENAAKEIRNLLNIQTKDLRVLKDNDVLKYWIKKIEALGILVFQYQEIDPIIMRGFVFAKIPFPTLAVNQRDSFYARVFTLVHELIHIILDKSGIIDPYYSLSEKRDKTEIFCNSVASEVLVPTHEFNEMATEELVNKSVLKNFLDEASKIWKVSWSVILIHLKELKRISNKLYTEMLMELKSKKQKKSGGGDYYRLFFSRNSENFLNLVFTGLYSKKVTYYEAMKFLNVSYKTLENVERKFKWER